MKASLRPVLPPQRIVLALAVASLAGCTTPTLPPSFTPMPSAAVTPGVAADELASDLRAVTPNTQVLAAPSIDNACGPQPVPVVRMSLPSPVLFATDSDQPLPGGGTVLDQVAGIIRRDSPTWQVTILGHTDAVGSDAFNMDLSRRRAAKVLRALVDRGIDPARLSAVAVGKRQPVASDATAAGRQLNRRVEFLVSECAGANLGLVRQTGGEGLPVEVLRLDPAYGLAPVGSITLREVAAEPTPAAAVLSPLAEPAPLHPPHPAAHPLPAPRYRPNPLAPATQPNPLGPAVPY